MLIMEIASLKGKIPNEVIESIVSRGISRLTPPQEIAVSKGLLSGKSMVVASPTASGKTLIAEIAMLNAVFARKKAVYIAPMRALVSEKYEEFKNAYPYLKIAMSIGDLDSLDAWLSGYDIIMVSTEKFDSLIRHGIGWLADVGCIVLDEVHMLGDPERGTLLEVLITKLKRTCKDAQFIALSATIGNANEIAEWLKAELVESDYRPIELKKGIVAGNRVFYIDGDEELAGSSKVPEARIAEDVLVKGKQLLVFYSTKRNAEAGAERLSHIVENFVQDKKDELSAVADEIEGALSRPTEQCKRLAKCVRSGVAFHHSGLVNVQRHAVEEAFKGNSIKVICSTTTLGLGVNLPAHTVLVRDTSRYSEGYGSVKMSVNEVTQLFGRAGRPKYDKEGRALLLAKSKEEVRDLYERYMNSALEPIESSLGIMPLLRSHILALIATKFLRSKEGITTFFGETFYGYQYSSMSDIESIIESSLNEFLAWGFVEKIGSTYSATRMGERVSELYIDPLSAKWIIDKMAEKRDTLANLFMITNTKEMQPYVRVTESAEDNFFAYVHMIDSSPSPGSIEDQGLGYYDPLKPFSTAMMLNEWIEEKSEGEIVKKYGTTPGALFSKITNADWLLYAAAELGRIMHVPTRDIVELRVRMRYGIKEELLDLIRLEQVGRVRARLLFNAGIRSVADIRKKESQELIKKMFTKDLAEKIISQAVGGIME
jgi:helicase